MEVEDNNNVTYSYQSIPYMEVDQENLVGVSPNVSKINNTQKEA